MPPFDAALLLREYGDEGLVRDLARLLIDTLPQQIDAVKQAVRARDCAAIRAAAHKLRGSIAPFGAAQGVNAARRLEAMAAEGNLSDADALCGALVADAHVLCDSARAWLEGPS